MENKNIVIRKVEDTKGNEVNIGDTVIMNVNDRVLVGVFAGHGAKGAWKFVGINELADVEFHIMPRCIKTMFVQNGEI